MRNKVLGRQTPVVSNQGEQSIRIPRAHYTADSPSAHLFSSTGHRHENKNRTPKNLFCSRLSFSEGKKLKGGRKFRSHWEFQKDSEERELRTFRNNSEAILHGSPCTLSTIVGLRHSSQPLPTPPMAVLILLVGDSVLNLILPKIPF